MSAVVSTVMLLFVTVGFCDGVDVETIGVASQEPTGEGLRFTSGEMNGEGTCLCTMQVPDQVTVMCTDYQAQRNLENITNIQRQISKLTLDVNKLQETTTRHAELFAAFESNLTEVTSAFDLIEGGRMLVTRVEIEGVLTRIRHMESTLYALREWHGIESESTLMGKIQVILDEASNISIIVDAMTLQDATAGSAALKREISSLTDQLQGCNEHEHEATGAATSESPAEESITKPTNETLGIIKENNTLPELWPVKEKQNTCGRLVGISEPYTVRGDLDYNGTWMRDPILHPEFVYFHSFESSFASSTSSSRSSPPPSTKFFTSLSVKSFQRKEAHQITGDLTHGIVESVVYNGSIFAYSKTGWSRDYNNGYYHYRPEEYKLIEMSLNLTSRSQYPAFTTGVVSHQRQVTETQLEQAPYLPSTAVPKTDLTVDETGLWLLYGDSLGMLTVSQVDQATLEFTRTMHGAYPKNRLANCFVVCAKVYCLNSYTEYDSKVSYFMDTETGFEGFTNVPFIIKYGSLSSVEYNPSDQMLYGWDKGHAVVYSLTFE